MTTDNFIYHEMMTHPALFTHAHPQKIAILGEQEKEILEEVLKHSNLTEIWSIDKQHSLSSIHEKVTVHIGNPEQWITRIPPNSFDILIVNAPLADTPFLHHCFLALTAEGILVQQSHSPFESTALRSEHDQFKAAGFNDIHPLHFPLPSYPSGWRMAWLATKRSVLRRASEKAVFNKTFKTRYYNFDVHKAALALPEFMREELIF